MSTFMRVATRCEASCREQVSSVCGWPAVGRLGDNRGGPSVCRDRSGEPEGKPSVKGLRSAYPGSGFGR